MILYFSAMTQRFVTMLRVGHYCLEMSFPWIWSNLALCCDRRHVSDTVMRPTEVSSSHDGKKHRNHIFFDTRIDRLSLHILESLHLILQPDKVRKSPCPAVAAEVRVDKLAPPYPNSNSLYLVRVRVYSVGSPLYFWCDHSEYNRFIEICI